MLDGLWYRLSRWWFVQTHGSSGVAANLCSAESGRAVSFPLSVDTFHPKQKAYGGSKLATSTLTTCFADLSSMICVTLARHLTCVPATLRCDSSSWFLSHLHGGCRAEGNGVDSDAFCQGLSEKHKALDRNGFDLFHLPTSYL